ncbi:MAG: fructosamine kinase family protein [Caldilineaceae bacterium]
MKNFPATLRPLVEQCVAAYLGRAWRITEVKSKHDESSHPAAILADDRYAIFIKLYTGEVAADQVTQEVAGLRLLTERAGVLTPTVIDLLPAEEGVLVVMEAVQAVRREEAQWRQIGQALAQIHQVKGAFYGLDTHNYWGSLYQDNRPLGDWPSFFWQRRLEPRLRAAVDTGNLPLALAAQVEELGNRLETLCGPPVPPTLLHGDAHQNNFISTPQGPVFIDPAVYYGHPEIDLAHIDFFAPVSPALLAGYQEIAPLAVGFAQRRNLWLIPTWLAMVEVDGPQHIEKLRNALNNCQ